MPELPEVETIRRCLMPRLVGLRVLTARLLRRDVLVAPGDPSGGFARQRGRGPGVNGRAAPPAALEPADLLEGCRIVNVLRHGKQLAIIARGPGRGSGAHGERALLVQLGMSGGLTLVEHPMPEDVPLLHVHALWTMGAKARAGARLRPGGGVALLFRDPRRFGGLRVFRSCSELGEHWAALGPDALAVTPEDLLRAARNSERAIKALLLDQRSIAGVGNIYADEALFRARIRPARPARLIKPAAAVALTGAVRSVLLEAIDAKGSTLRDYRGADGLRGGFQLRHAVYGRGGQPCPSCARRLSEATVAQRTTVWCVNCQR